MRWKRRLYYLLWKSSYWQLSRPPVCCLVLRPQIYSLFLQMAPHRWLVGEKLAPKVCLDEELVQPLLELELTREYNSGLPHQHLLLQLHSGMSEPIVCRVSVLGKPQWWEPVDPPLLSLD